MTATPARGGGLDRYFFSLLRALPAHRVAAIGVATGGAGQIAASNGIESLGPDSVSLARKWAELRRVAKRLVPKVDIIVSHFALNAFPMLDRFRDRPFIVHFQGPWALEGAAEGGGRLNVAAKRALERIVYGRAQRFLVLSSAFARILEREYKVQPELIRQVPGGVDLHCFSVVGSRREARKAMGWPDDRPTILTAGRLVRLKGLEQFIAAIDQVRRVVPDVQAVVAGSGPLATELRRRVDEADLTRWIRFAGHLSDDNLRLAYRAADLLVVPTPAIEGFGLVVAEALACGTPALVTPTGGLPEVVAELDCNLILESSEVGAIARGIIAALRNPSALPDEMACASYAQRFDWEQVAAKVAAVYREPF